MQLLRVLIGAPFSFVWLCITNFRNFLYDAGILKSTGFSIPVICVGNLAVGGTGKTPTINFLVKFLLLEGKKVGIVSRGYGRRSKGFFYVNGESTAASAGDEPLLLFKRWGDKVVVAVGERRLAAIRTMRENHPGLEVILMDDGYQHRSVQPTASVLLTSFQNPFYDDFVMPSGTLREGRRWAKRASMVVVTKTDPGLEAAARSTISAKIGAFAGTAPVFFSSIEYGKPVSFGKEADYSKRVFLITGIANPDPLLSYLKGQEVEVVCHWAKADHFTYSRHEMELIIEEYQNQQDSVILTTEKDFMKIGIAGFQEFLEQAPFFYIPVEFSFSKEKENFEASLRKIISKNREG